ncbi:MAG: rRNA maturation RNase YbeY [Candidatus Pacebacteria bacterium]|nr:rRNA maturation RNase YbeY [Candidatus Paceibacterota bacterium]
MIKLNLDNQTDYQLDRSFIQEKVKQVLNYCLVDHVQLDLAIVNDLQIAPLNKQYLNHKGPTDVLSFPTFESIAEIKKAPPLADEPTNIGQLVVNYQQAEREAKDSSKTVKDKLSFYIEHGLMHLLGYHHQ